MCGRRQREKEKDLQQMNHGDMDFLIVKTAAFSLPVNTVVQLHNNGEPLLYEQFGKAVEQFYRQITNIVTNGKLLLEKSDEIIGNLDTMAISVFEKDGEQDEQYSIMEQFFKLKGDKKPYTIIRLNGEVDDTRYKKFNVPFARRLIHAPQGSFNYQKGTPTIPEVGICWDFLHHLAVDKDGDVSICVRYDPERLGVLGNIKDISLHNIWHGEKRQQWMEHHKCGRRDLVPLCAKCEYWGIPTGKQ